MAMNPRLLRPTANDSPASIPGLALWLDASASDALYTTDAGPVTAVGSPLDISGCALWLDASDASTISDTAGAVDQWDDKSGNARHFTGTTTARPTTGTRTQNGRNVLDFGGAQSLVGNAAALSIARNVSGLTAFVVARYDSVAASQQMLFQAQTNASTARFTIDGGAGFNPGTNMRLGGRRLDADAFDFAAAAAFSQNTNDTVFAGTIAYSAATAILHANGSAIATDGTFQTAGNTSDTDSSSVTIGSSPSVQNPTDGYIAEVIVYNTALSTSDRARVEAYLAAKWGISGVHAPAVTASDPVGYWRDRSGNGRHATQSTAASRPVNSGTGWSGRPSVDFTRGSSHFLEFTPFALTTQTAFFVIEPTAALGVNDGPTILNNITSTAGQFNRYAFVNASGYKTYVAALGAAISGNPGAVGANLFEQAKLLISHTYNNAGSTTVGNHGLRRFGAPIPAESSSVVLGSSGASKGRIGCRSPGNAGATNDEFLSARLAEILVYNRVLSGAELSKIERYLARRWGITLAPQVANAEAQDWISRVYAAGSTVSQPVANAVSDFVTGCQSDGIWDAMKSVVLLAGADTLAGALAPLKGTAPTPYNFASGDYNKTSGLKGNGSSTYLSGTFSAVQNDIHFSVYSTSNTGLGGAVDPFSTPIASKGAAGNVGQMQMSLKTTETFLRGQAATGDTVPEAPVIGFSGASRSGSASYVFRRGNSETVIARASDGPGVGQYSVFANPTPDQFSPQRLAFFSLGNALDLALLDARVSTLMTAIGVS